MFARLLNNLYLFVLFFDEAVAAPIIQGSFLIYHRLSDVNEGDGNHDHQ